MNSISRNASELAANEKAAIETVLGHALRENQRVIIQVIDVDLTYTGSVPTPAPTIGDFAIFSDMEDDELSELAGVSDPSKVTQPRYPLLNHGCNSSGYGHPHGNLQGQARPSRGNGSCLSQ